MIYNRKRSTGALIAETAAAMSLLVPLVFLLIFVICEVSHAYLIKTTLSDGSRRAARNLAIAYGQDPAIGSPAPSGNAGMQAQIFDKIRVSGIIADNSQFTDVTFDTSSPIHTVSVTVRYVSNGSTGLPQFPNPDPLNWAPQGLASQATYRLE